MPPKVPHPTPIPEPKFISIKCPNCSKVSNVKLEQALLGFICPGCGQKVDGIKPPAPGP